jgi:hypothetical protein
VDIVFRRGLQTGNYTGLVLHDAPTLMTAAHRALWTFPNKHRIGIRGREESNVPDFQPVSSVHNPSMIVRSCVTLRGSENVKAYLSASTGHFEIDACEPKAKITGVRPQLIQPARDQPALREDNWITKYLRSAGRSIHSSHQDACHGMSNTMAEMILVLRLARPDANAIGKEHDG